MTTALSNLLALLSLDDTAYRKGLASALKESDSFSEKLAKVGGGVVVGGLSLAVGVITAVGTAAWTAGNTVDEAMDAIAVKTGATGPTLQALQKDFETVFASIPTDASTAAAVIGQVNAQLEYTGPVLQDVSKNLLEFSRLTKTDAATNAAQFGQIVSSWKIPAADASQSLNAIFVAAQSTGVPVGDLMQIITTAGPVLREFGFGFNDATALMSQMYAAGLDDTTMMVGLRSAAADFAKTNTPLKQGLADTVKALQSATDPTWALNKAVDVFGTKAGPLMLDAIRAGKLDFADLANELGYASDAILETGAATADWPEKWKTFSNAATVALAPIGAKMMEAVGGAMDAVIVLFNRPDVQAGIGKLAEWVGTAITQAVSYIPVLISGFLQFVNFLQNNQGVVVAILAALGVAVIAWAVVTAVAAWTAMAPFLPVIAVIVLLAAAAYLLYQAWTSNWGGIQEKTAAVWAWLQGVFNSIVAAILAVWNNPLIQMAVQTLVTNIQMIIGAFQAAFSGDWTRFGEMLRMVWDNAWHMIYIILLSAWDWIKTTVSNLIDNVISFFRDTDWGQVGRNIIAGIRDGILAAVGWLKEAARTAAQAALDAAKGFLGIKSPSTVFETQVGWNMAAGVARGWERGLSTLLPAGTLNLQPAGAGGVALPGPGVSTATGEGEAPASEDALLREVYRMLRDLPNTLARANRDAFEKARRD